MAHILKNHFATFYTAERTPTEPPKGVYTFVAQCGFSGVILGPPNHHDYQNQLHKLHNERFSRMPFEAFKARVKIVREEAVVKKWVEDQSFKTEYVCLNVPEPLRLASMEDVEKHFRAVHKDAIVKPVETYTIAGVPSRTLKCHELQRLIRAEWEQQKHFPLPLATSLSRSFASHGLHFFKVNKTVTHVAVARPQYLDLDASPVSENIKRIVTYIEAHPKCTRRKMVETLAPAPKVTVLEVGPDAPKPPAPDQAEPTPEQTALIADLHWLVHQGHVLEFADGKLETAKKPAPKPVREPKPASKVEPSTAAAATTTETHPEATHDESSEASHESVETAAAHVEAPVTGTSAPTAATPVQEIPVESPALSPEPALAPVAEITPVVEPAPAPVADAAHESVSAPAAS